MDQPITWPHRLTPALRRILGFPNFKCASLAHAYKAIGEYLDAEDRPLESRAEDEQAFVIHRMVAVVMQDPDNWEDAITLEVRRVQEALEALKAKEPVNG